MLLDHIEIFICIVNQIKRDNTWQQSNNLYYEPRGEKLQQIMCTVLFKDFP